MELSCSAGIATYPADAEDASSLCQLADGALYWAKRRGKRRTRRFDPEHVPLAWTDQQARRDRRPARGPSAITPVFQPVVDLASGHLVGYEALARFSASPRRSPEAWFAQAHGCGLGRRARRGGDPRRAASRWAGRSGPTWRSTSARRPSPRSRWSERFPPT